MKMITLILIHFAHRFRPRLTFPLLSLFLFPCVSTAANQTVTSLGDSGPGSLRAAIAAVGTGQTITFAVNGAIELTSGELLIDSKAMTITGPGGNAVTVRRSLAPGTADFPCFKLIDAVMTIEGLTISNGRYMSGGGMAIYRGNTTLRNCRFSGNAAIAGNTGFGFGGIGGAVFYYATYGSSMVTMETCTFTGNTATRDGAAVYSMGFVGPGHANAILKNCTFAGNHADFQGGAIANVCYTEGITDMLLEDCVITRNTAGGDGGGIFNSTRTPGLTVIDPNIRANLTLRRCTVSENTAGNHGGGIASAREEDIGHTQFVISESTLSGNTADRGGALYCTQSGQFRNTTIAGNSASVWGGALQCGSDAPGGVTLTSCTLSNNVSPRADIMNFGVLGLGSTILQRGSIVQNIENGTYNGVGATVVSSGNNLSDDDGGGWLNQASDLINTNPQLDPAGLKNNGGPVATIALTAASPALDRGYAWGQTTDARGPGFPRIFDLPSYSNAFDGADIGAFEASDPMQSGPVFAVTTLADHDDGVAGQSDCTLREAIRQSNAVPGPNAIIFAPGVTGNLPLSAGLGELIVTDALTLTGPGARLLSLNGAALTRILSFTAPENSILSRLTLTNGKAPAVSGGGGGLLNSGTLTVNDCVFEGNFATGLVGSQQGVAGMTVQGGGIFNSGSLALNRCALAGNYLTGGAGAGHSGAFGRGGDGGAAQGGAVYNAPGALLHANNCTFYGNVATGGKGGDALSFAGGNGGPGHAGVYNMGSALFTACTLSGNTGNGGARGLGNNNANHGGAGTGYGALTSAGGVYEVRTSISAGNTGAGGPDASGSFLSTGWNVIGKRDGSTGFTHTGDQTGTVAAPLDARLGPFQNNGGPTNSMNLLAGSPAVDQGRNYGHTTDQRGQARTFDVPFVANPILGDGTDTGAVETDPIQTGPVFYVTTLDDHNDGSPTGRDCTLREAILAANNAPGVDTIRIQAGVTGACVLTLGELLITSPLTLEGPGADVLALDGNGAGHIFRLDGSGFQLDVSISGFTLRNARGSSAGGAISNALWLTVADCAFAGNTVSGAASTNPGQAGAPGRGAAIFNEETLTLLRCTFSGNTAGGGAGANDTASLGRGGAGGPAEGAVFNAAGASLTVVNSTFAGNTGTGGRGGNGPNFAGGNGGHGCGALFNLGTMSLTACTLSGNTGTGGAGGTGSNFINNGAPGAGTGGIMSSGAASVANTIVAGNTGGFSADISGAFASQGWNLIGKADGSTGFTAGGDQTGTNAAPLNAVLGPLGANGGPVQTLSPLPGSPAIDKGRAFSLTSDQRGLARRRDDPAVSNAPGGDGTDTGAVEVQTNSTFIAMTPAGNGMRITCQDLPQQSYQLQFSSDIGSGFANLGPPQTTDTLGRTEFTDPGPLPARRFYQVIPVP